MLPPQSQHKPIRGDAGQPAIVMLNPDALASLLETLEILSDRALMASIREGMAQAEAGQTVSLEMAQEQLILWDSHLGCCCAQKVVADMPRWLSHPSPPPTVQTAQAKL
ncbi:hypothetical protein [Trichothermofontia sp.]